MKVLLKQFESIGVQNALILKKEYNIEDVDDFLLCVHEGRFQKLKSSLKDKGLDESLVERWAQIIDLFRVPTIMPRDAEILREININSVEELAHRDAISILQKMQFMEKESYFIILQYPSITKVENWIYYAKLMTRRIKVGYAIPLICFFPIIKFHHALELEKYHIWTIEDFEIKFHRIPKLHQKIGMKENEWKKLLDLIDLVRIDGIDLYVAKTLFECGIISLAALQNLNRPEEVFPKIELYQSQGIAPELIITRSLLETFVVNAKKEISFWRYH